MREVQRSRSKEKVLNSHHYSLGKSLTGNNMMKRAIGLSASALAVALGVLQVQAQSPDTIDTKSNMIQIRAGALAKQFPSVYGGAEPCQVFVRANNGSAINFKTEGTEALLSPDPTKCMRRSTEEGKFLKAEVIAQDQMKVETFTRLLLCRIYKEGEGVRIAECKSAKN